MSDPTDTPSTDGAPDPEEVIARRRLSVWDSLAKFDDLTPEDRARRLADARGDIAALAAAGLRIVEDHPAPEVGGEPCGDLGPGDESLPLAAGVPALDDDTRREVEQIVTDHRNAAKVALSNAATTATDREADPLRRIAWFHTTTADLLAAAYLGRAER